jgi:hypothetical protein
VVWFTHDLDGRALWLSGATVEQGGKASLDLYRTSGTRFGNDFNARDLQVNRVGQMHIDFQGCDTANARFEFDDRRYVMPNVQLLRLTKPDVVGACVAP